MQEISALITSEDIRKYDFHNDVAIDATVYTPEFIYSVQIERIKSIFPDLYSEIEIKLINGDELSSIESEFIDRIKHPLALHCRVKMLPQRHVQESNSGASLLDGDHYRQLV